MSETAPTPRLSEVLEDLVAMRRAERDESPPVPVRSG